MFRNTIIIGLACGIGHLPAYPQAPPGEVVAKVIQQNPLSHRRLTESSGLAASASQPGVLWTLNDSGNPPELFAMDIEGRILAVFNVRGAANRDWEALSVAPCGESSCLYVGEVGDNNERYPDVTIYRVREPRIHDSAGEGELVPDAIMTLTYPDRSHDVEAMFVTSTGRVFLISKGRMNDPKLYYADMPTEHSGLLGATARLVQQVEVPAPTGLAYRVTDAALARDGQRVAVRTYRYIYFFRFDGSRLLPDPGRGRCDATGVDAQGEAITWLDDDRLATTSERLFNAGGTITEFEC